VNYIVKILEADFVTHDVKRFSVEKPDNYLFRPGQGTDLAINAPGWSDQFRSFNFTSLSDWPYLEFTIKIHPRHNGVTKQLGKTNAGAELIIKEPYGNIIYKEPGVFIAGGSGITPFISIFRSLAKTSEIEKCSLIYSNKTAADIIYYQELLGMLQDRFVNILTREQHIGFTERRINTDFLIENIRDFSQHFYVCGPDDFVKNVSALLLELGATADSLIF
jgi:ferredoxin-NADP reductase